MKLQAKPILLWLALGPVFALLLSLFARRVYENFSPEQLADISTMLSSYPLGLAMSLLTPWGWLMYGGLFLLTTGKSKLGLWCTSGGAVIFGLFWPVWVTFLSR